MSDPIPLSVEQRARRLVWAMADHECGGLDEAGYCEQCDYWVPRWVKLLQRVRDERDEENERLKADQRDWRKGVELIASYLGESDPPDLSCVRIAHIALELRGRIEALEEENKKLRGAMAADDELADAVLGLREELTHLKTALNGALHGWLGKDEAKRFWEEVEAGRDE